MKLQARARKLICGAFKTTARAISDVEIYLIGPVSLLLDVFQYGALLRPASSPSYVRIMSSGYQDSLLTNLKQSNACFAKLSPLHKLESRFTEAFKKDLSNLEKSSLFLARPRCNAPLISIASNTKDAFESHNSSIRNPSNFAIYTNGSGMNHRIGAAAVEMFTPIPRAFPITTSVKSAYLGKDTEFTVHDGEFQGLSMALEIIAEDNSDRQAIIFTDSQAAICAVGNLHSQSGQYILHRIAT